MTPPAKLYKYCPFKVFSLRAISEAEIFHASPQQFNDPLDCNPTLDLDVSTDDGIRLLRQMLEQSGETPDRIEQEIRSLRYSATEVWDDEPDTPGAEDARLRWSLGRDILNRLRAEMATYGVLSLSETYSSVLMWSHYSDHHRGLCLEYDTSLMPVQTLGAVDYRAPRAVRADDLLRWKFEGSADAEKRVRQTYFYAKSKEWAYEREWRDISPRVGANTLNFKLTAIHFGLRTDVTVQQTIAKVLARDRDIELFAMWAREDSFQLERFLVERDYFEQSGIRQPPFIVFGTRFVEPPSDAADG
ncbi:MULTISPECIES: DUF2971 domain-containing protein [unclassified Sphingomonas]|uniref:DUF2971 domain-containing protein n=1 Tax=unclassified Sphingomonas TaxID=196159 RepID=UPI0006F20B20|nr:MULTISPECIES: DUF2971 domain-containing protein [unclassified Sphingomonas]KQX19179.1 hypothetical protein ASD17_11490 [Sphingomonas sp. Root1294]KQY65380.1 hypothetical protein ASD39_14685 [Sphingomonas sp. Root50]KRB95325.1 hypothetical protein ASE22_05370 [Sphingomonas sp. Root720]